MALSLDPRQNGGKSQQGDFYYHYVNGKTNYSEYLRAESGWVWRRDSTSGWIQTLSDGTKFRHPTPYETYGCQMDYGPCRISGYADIRKREEDYRESQDSREIPDIFRQNWALAGLQPDDQGVRNAAISKAMSKMTGDTIGMGENLATLMQTFAMFKNKTLLGGRILDEVIRSKNAGLFLNNSFHALRKKGVSRAIADEYLEYLYGWKPLAQDIHDGLEMFKKQAEKPLIVSGHSRSSRKFKSSQGPWRQLSWSQYRRKSLESSIIGRCSIYATVNKDNSNLRMLNQLGLANPLSLAWELMPWSFMIDWFIPIGQTLSNLTASAGLTFLSGTYSAKMEEVECFDYRTYAAGIYPPLPIENSSSLGYCNIRKEGYRRDWFGSFPLAGLYIDANPLRGLRGSAALALLTQKLSKFR